MKIESPTNEMPEIASDKVIVFPQGIIGFEEHREFHIYQHAEDDVVGYLESLSDPQVTFSIISPADMQIFFEFSLGDEEAALLEADSVESIQLFVIAYRGQQGEGADLSPVNANFNAPLLINVEKRIGMQKVLLHPRRQVIITAD